MDKWIIAYYQGDENKGYERHFLEFFYEDNALEKYEYLRDCDDILNVYLAKVIR